MTTQGTWLRDAGMAERSAWGVGGTAQFVYTPTDAADLRRFSIPEHEYLAWRDAVTSAEANPVHLAEVRIQGLQQVSPEYVESHLQNLQPDADVDSRQIKEDTDRLYALGIDAFRYRMKKFGFL